MIQAGWVPIPFGKKILEEQGRFTFHEPLKQFPVLCDLVSQNKAMYCLPEFILNELAKDVPLFHKRLNAELALTRYLSSNDAIGIYGNQLIVCPLFERSKLSSAQGRLTGTILKGRLRLSGIKRIKNSTITQLEQTLQDSTGNSLHRTLRRKDFLFRRALAASLLLNEDFLREHDKLWRFWQSMPMNQTLPSYTPILTPSKPVASDRELIEKMTKWNNLLHDFLNKFTLERLADWNLPVPMSMQSSTTGLPSDSLALRLPSLELMSHPLAFQSGNQQLLSKVSNALSSQLAREPAVGAHRMATKRQANYSFYLDIMHWEKCIRSRWRDSKVPHGSAKVIEQALASFLHVSINHLQRTKSQIRKFLRGHQSRRIGKAHIANARWHP